MGLATLLVLFVHGNYFVWPKAFALLHKLTYEGSIGVEIFLFVSAIGLYFSFTKEQNILEFYKRRFMRVLPIFWLIMIVTLGIIEFAFCNKSFLHFASALTGLSYWFKGAHAVWYVSFILPLYALYPALYACTEHCGKKMRFAKFVFFIVLALAIKILLIIFCKDYYLSIELAVKRLPIFLLGAFFAKNVYNAKPFMQGKKLQICFLFIAFVALFLLIRLCNMHIFIPDSIPYNSVVKFSNIFLCFIVIMLSIFVFRCLPHGKDNILCHILRFFGKYSLEIYIMHMQVIAIYRNIKVFAPYQYFWVYYAIIVPLSVVLAVAFAKLLRLLQGICKR